MAQEPHQIFGQALKRYRVTAGLSQEQLAERAGLTAQGISALERGVRHKPYPDTVERLATALGLSDADRTAFDAAVVRVRRPVSTPIPISLPDAVTARPHTPFVPAHHLPAQPTPLIGRARDVAEVMAVLRQGDARLLTLTGLGGVGKTRLALRVAQEALDVFADGVVFVALAPLREPTLVVATIAGALEIRDTGGQSLLVALYGRLRDRHVLLLLDNFEHVAEAAPLVADLLAACPRLSILVTSRAILRLRGERVYPVPPLATPDPARLPPTDVLATIPAVDLLMQRARDLVPDFALDATNASAIAVLCRRLDGLPLALELAAARLRVLSPQALLGRLDHRLPLLTAGARDLPERQRTLRATLEWSHDLLTAGERALFRRLAVFAGDATLDVIEVVCLDGADAADAAVDGVAALVDKSLLRRESALNGEPRFGMLETVREYAREQLAAHGEEEAVRRRHLAHYLALAEHAQPRLWGPDQAAWLERLEQDHNNLRAAMAWAMEAGDLGAALRLATAVWWFWWTRGTYVTEGRGWLDALLAVPHCREDPTLASSYREALHAAAMLARAQSDFGRAVALATRSLDVCRTAGDLRGAGAALYNLGMVRSDQGDAEGAAALLGESLKRRRNAGDAQGMAHTLNGLGIVAWGQGRDERAASFFRESLAVARGLGNRQSMAMPLTNLGEMAQQRKDYDQAVALQEEALAIKRELGDPAGIANSLTVLGHVARLRGDHDRAMDLYGQALPLYRAAGYRSGIAEVLEGIAGVLHAPGQAEQGVRLCAAAAALRDADGEVALLANRGPDATMAALRAMVGEDAYAESWAAGLALPLEQAVAEAMALAANETFNVGNHDVGNQ